MCDAASRQKKESSNLAILHGCGREAPEQRASYEVESREWLNLPTYYAEH